nr:MAG TPA: hypothetical protein [Caudoviricetes sp.]
MYDLIAFHVCIILLFNYFVNSFLMVFIKK